jgi:uncharacterized membrane protein YedE/YeeE
MNTPLFRVVVALTSGAVFGFGLSLSGMLNPVRVRGFLDITGNWDPRLAFVLGGAVGVTAIAWRLAERFHRPAFDIAFHLPKYRSIDGRLIVGSAIFGIGWGMVGLCPGPALAGLSLGLPASFLFIAAMLIGMMIHDRLSMEASLARAS